ncbi:MAG: flagellar biosynthetic protein FliO [SAR324 cluster bacterium]|nr:flagellar biosynthetic protein FliO [SAR324 cluster bacterium]
MRLRSSSLLSGLLLCLLLALPGAPLMAQNLPRLLEDIKVLEVQGREAVSFRFSQPYEGVPLQEHAPGSFSLNFSGTGSAAPVRNFRAPESKVIQSIRVVQNRFSTTVTFKLKDSASSLRDRLVFNRDKNVLRVTIGAKAAAAPPPLQPPREENLFSQMSKTITGQSALPAQAGPAQPATPAPAAQGEPQTLGQFKGVEWMSTLLTLVFSVAAIIGVLYLVLYLYKRFFGGRMARLGSAYPIKMVSSFHIGPKQRIVVLNINGEIVACGVTSTQISYLTRLGGGGPEGQRRAAAPRPARPAPAGGGKNSSRGAAAQAATEVEPATATAKAAPAAAKSAKADPVQQFAEALKDKVSSMKRIR